MKIGLFVDLLILTCIAMFGMTQIILPIWRGTKLFPWWRHARSSAEHDLVVANEKREVETIKGETRLVLRKTKSIRSK